MWSALAWRWCAVMLTGSQRYAFCNDRFHNRKITRLRNNFMPNILPTDLCANTPTLAIHDNRGFAIRTLAYNRRDHNETIGELISRNRYNASGQLIASR
ncbi:hypothetical protein, partial [Yersinia pestis]